MEDLTAQTKLSWEMHILHDLAETASWQLHYALLP
jgi:hypothetical protein